MYNYSMVIYRRYDNGLQTLGNGCFYRGLDLMHTFSTLELSDKGNQPFISCIPRGEYNCIQHWSPKNGMCFKVEPVVNRSHIQIHAGNFYDNTEGCILVGADFQDINQDKNLDVIESRATMNKLIKIADAKPFLLKII